MDANELVERVAGSMYASDHKGMANVWAWDEAGLEDEHPGIRDIYLRKARAALREIVAAAGGVEAVAYAATTTMVRVMDRRQFEAESPTLVVPNNVVMTDNLEAAAKFLRALAEGGKDA